jgi:hypothetical protein
MSFVWFSDIFKHILRASPKVFVSCENVAKSQIDHAQYYTFDDFPGRHSQCCEMKFCTKYRDKHIFVTNKRARDIWPDPTFETPVLWGLFSHKYIHLPGRAGQRTCWVFILGLYFFMFKASDMAWNADSTNCSMK